MSAPKIKTIILAILVMANLFLLAIVLPARREAREREQAVYANLQTLFASYGVTLDETLPEEQKLYPLVLEPDVDEQRAAAEALLGEETEEERGVGSYLSIYRSDAGACRFARGGSFSAELTQVVSASGDLQRAAERLLKNMGFRCASISDAVRQSAGIYTVTACQSADGVPVFSAELELTFSNGALTAIEGEFYTGLEHAATAEQTACIACADALIAFLNSRDELGWVGSRIEKIEQGYLKTETASASTVRLNPVWRVETDTGAFYVNGLDASVSAAG